MPITGDPNSNDVKAALFMYSMESFLYRRLNEISRDKDTNSILTLGPFAVLLTRIIDKAQRKREHKYLIQGSFDVFRGISISRELIDKWSKQKILSLDGYSSSTLDRNLAVYFANKG